VSGSAVRDDVEMNLRRELYGPDGLEIGAIPLDTSKGISFLTRTDARHRWCDLTTGEEILTVPPRRRYGVGVLYPVGSPPVDNDQDGEDVDEDPDEDAPVDDLSGSTNAKQVLDVSDDFDLSETQSRNPSALAVTALVRDEVRDLRIEFSGATYRRISVTFGDGTRDRTWWVREPFSGEVEVGLVDLEREGRLVVFSDPDGGVEVSVHSRRGIQLDGSVYVTAAMANRSISRASKTEIYQCELRMLSSGGAFSAFDLESHRAVEEEEREELDLLYKAQRTFAIGHGCAATWNDRPSGEPDEVWTEAFPSYETNSVTADVVDGNGKSLGVRMEDLAVSTAKGAWALLDPLLSTYEEWVQKRTESAAEFTGVDRRAAERLLSKVNIAMGRIRRGLQILAEDDTCWRSFALMNRAMASQQVNINKPLLDPVQTASGLTFQTFLEPAVTPTWRPFQIGFLLLSLAGLADGLDEDREIVDLIFFPTGGGKTEAYLGAAAFFILLGRMRDPESAGVNVLMRYTLRLLSTQQFQRAAALICALEGIRRENAETLGSQAISLGLWVGRSVSPNRNQDALDRLKKLQKYPLREPNPFLLDKCPHCGAKMGVFRPLRIVVGYEVQGSRVAFVCKNRAGSCPFSKSTAPLPIYLVDEDVYRFRPTLVIATVDKFAMLSRVPEARAIFNIDEDGGQLCPPPGLIIQDELHLITGPLGSMVGLYEAVIEELCTSHGEKQWGPKIIAATATIRNYSSQVRDLYGRSQSALFPPQGLSSDDSFFGTVQRDGEGNPAAGRKYVGVFASGFNSVQTTQVRVAAAISQAPALVNEQGTDFVDSDPYWTAVWFFNSLRELGNTVSLVQSDIPDYLTGLALQGRLVGDTRWPRRVIELTSRRDSEKIPETLRELEAERWSGRAIDMCLASSIMEVGVDVSRLSLLAIVGQPKTTAQYIQVSGRVGRRGPVAPGLVVTIYSTMRSRDRSHFERFRTYHQALYAQVEAGSVTPFALPTLRRALHGPLISYVRMKSPLRAKASDFPTDLFRKGLEVVMARVGSVDPGSQSDVSQLSADFQRLWEDTLPGQWDYAWATEKHYGSLLTDVERALMRGRSDPIALAGVPDQSKMTPTSMRSVDAETVMVTGGNPYTNPEPEEVS
jgi:hypothetical protein